MRLLVLILGFTAFASPLHAQTVVVGGCERDCAPGPASGQGSSQTVMANFSVSQPVAANATSAELSAAMAAASQRVYDIVNRQCDVLSVAFKANCRMVQITVSANSTSGTPVRGSPGVSAHGSASFELSTAPAAPAGATAPPAHQ